MSNEFAFINDKIASIPSGMCMNLDKDDFRKAAKAFISSEIFDSVRASDVSSLEDWLEDFHGVSVVEMRGCDPYRDYYKVCK